MWELQVNVKFPWPKDFDVRIHIGGRSNFAMGAILLGQAVIAYGEYLSLLTGLLMVITAVVLADINFSPRVTSDISEK